MSFTVIGCTSAVGCSALAMIDFFVHTQPSQPVLPGPWFGESGVEKEIDRNRNRKRTCYVQGGPDDPQPRTSRTCLGIFESWRIKSWLGPERSLRTSSGIAGTVTTTRRAGGTAFLCTHKVRRVILRSSLISLAPVLYLTSPFSNVSFIFSSFHSLHSLVSHLSFHSRLHSFVFSQLSSPLSLLSSLISRPSSPCTSLSSLFSIPSSSAAGCRETLSRCCVIVLLFIKGVSKKSVGLVLLGGPPTCSLGFERVGRDKGGLE